MTLAVIFALLAYFGWGSGDVFAVKATRKIGSFGTAAWTYILTVLVFALYIPFALHDFGRLSLPILFLNVVLGLLLAVCWIFFNQALKVGNPPIVGTIAGSFVALVVIFSILFLKETINGHQILAIVLIFIGIIMTTLDLKSIKHKTAFDAGAAFALLTMIGWGIYFTFIKIPIKHTGWFVPNYVSLLVGTAFYLAISKNSRFKLDAPRNKKTFSWLFWSAMLTGIATFSFNFALQKGNTAIVAPIAGAYPTLFAILAYYVFKEPLSNQQKTGILLSLTGIVALSILSV